MLSVLKNRWRAVWQLCIVRIKFVLRFGSGVQFENLMRDRWTDADMGVIRRGHADNASLC